MNILVDKAMPYWQDYFASFSDNNDDLVGFNAGDLKLDESGEIANAHLHTYLAKVEALLIRSTTKVDEKLLSLMPQLKFVATATAGYDHLDIQALNNRGICWHAAGGCNAQAVAQYVTCAVLTLAVDDNFIISEKTIAIVGNGNVGSKVASAMIGFGAKVIIYDPPQAANANKDLQYADFEDVKKADIICIHAPFNSHTAYPTLHLFDHEVLASLSSQQYLINAGRGELIDNNALLAMFEVKQKKGVKSPHVVLDVWEDEPNIRRSLIKYLRLASAHIAGHTLEGKAKGTHMVYEHLCDFAKVEANIALETLLPEYNQELDESLLAQWHGLNQNNAKELQAWLKKLCDSVYLIQNDDSVFRAGMAQSNSFAAIRREYPIRREFSALDIKAPNKTINKLLRDIGFIISNDS